MSTAPGRESSVGDRSAYDLYLVARVEARDARPRADVPEVADFFVARKLDVAAGVRQQLEADAKRLPGLRVLDGRFMVINQAMGTSRSRVAGNRYLIEFVTTMKSSGFVAQSLATARHRRRDGGSVTGDRRHAVAFSAGHSANLATPQPRRRSLRALLLALVALVIGCAGAHAASRSPVGARNGMVVTSQHLATKVGVDILKRGGNADRRRRSASAMRSASSSLPPATSAAAAS